MANCSTLISWIGGKDIAGIHSDQNGPLLSAIQQLQPQAVHLLYNYPKSEVSPYIEKLQSEFHGQLSATHEPLSSPINFSEIYQAADKHLKSLQSQQQGSIAILLSPGTPAMQAVWILLGKTRYPATFYQASVEEGVKQVEIPFDISAEFLPGAPGADPLHTPVDAAFDDIVTQNPQMLKLKAQASHLAQFDLPVLIYGETGTGKELFATAIHNASSRKGKPFVALNCGAIPSELIDSTLFGHIKGAFTGAHKDASGVFRQADGGTLFLDEFGELPAEAQVRLLRVLQSGELVPVGSANSVKVDVRVIAATNRDLLQEVVEGRFREDLFYRIAVGVLNLPPLRQRSGDLSLLIDALLEQIAQQGLPGAEHKKVSSAGRNVLLSHAWRGNIRELYSTLLRAAMWSSGATISKQDVEAALFKVPETNSSITGREFDKNFNIQDVMSELARHYISRAMDETQGNLTQAAELLGLASYQTLKSWITKYKVN